MKDGETKEESTSTIQRLIERRKLTEEQYIGLARRRFRTAQDRRINNFNDLIIKDSYETKEKK